METKMQISHKCLWNCLEIIPHVKGSLIYLEDEVKRKKLLNYLVRFFEILEKFCSVYFDYKYPSTINRFSNDTVSETKKVCDCISDLVKVIKVRVSVFLRNNGKANDIIKHISFKAITKLQKYIIHIDYFNREMLRKSVLNMD